MNRSKQHIDIRASKKVKKAVRLSSSISTREPLERSDTLTVNTLLKKYRKKVAAKDKSVALPAIKRAELKKNKRKVSKRTSPSEVHIPKNSAHEKPEGLRWIQNLEKQSLAKSQIMTKQMNKRSNKRVAITKTKTRMK